MRSASGTIQVSQDSPRGQPQCMSARPLSPKLCGVLASVVRGAGSNPAGHAHGCVASRRAAPPDDRRSPSRRGTRRRSSSRRSAARSPRRRRDVRPRCRRACRRSSASPRGGSRRAAARRGRSPGRAWSATRRRCEVRSGITSATPACSSSAAISCSSAEVATTRSLRARRSIASNARLPGVGCSVGSRAANNACFRATIASAAADPGSSPAASGSSLSLPMPMSGRICAGPRGMPCSVRAWAQVSACAALLSINVPSTSKSIAHTLSM